MILQKPTESKRHSSVVWMIGILLGLSSEGIVHMVSEVAARWF